MGALPVLVQGNRQSVRWRGAQVSHRRHSKRLRIRIMKRSRKTSLENQQASNKQGTQLNLWRSGSKPSRHPWRLRHGWSWLSAPFGPTQLPGSNSDMLIRLQTHSRDFDKLAHFQPEL